MPGLGGGAGIASHNTACCIHRPIANDPLLELYAWVKTNMQHNFIPCMFLAGSSCLAMHYSTIIKSLLFCPIPIAYGKASGTGKTTALSVTLSPTGAYPARFVSQASYAKYADQCSSSNLPLAIDDPKSRIAISDLVVALFSGMKGPTMTWGEKLPHSMAIISANFTTIEKEK